ncbi:GGDEF domain-containing protein [Bacillus sp. AFS040349]|uniref:GGDEF domain-containing protein n=1 Tax=Bacillus sp. AFS040349 TaxID=2033502 RepID=UPI00159BD2A2|nr:GGDEF domain-containing protein [Bacillus sp. AFS040349]
MEMALMYLDIDSFKQVNDTFGHAGGDAILIEFSRRIQNSIRNKDIVCRLSGDEFVIIVSIPSDEEVVQKIASQIQVELKQPILFEHHQIRITASIGISIYNDVELTSEELIKRADNALYEVKENGKNDVTFWCDSFVNK